MLKTRKIVREILLVETSCYSCECVFMVPDWLDRQAREKGREWFCPACGRKTVYSESEIQKLQRELDNQVDYWKRQYEHACEREQIAENRRRSTAGAMTKLKRRVGAGVCPCCKRTVSQLARHMQTKHPNYPNDEDGA